MFLIDSKCYIALIYYRKAIKKKKKKSTCPYRYILLADLCFYSKTIMDLKKKNVKNELHRDAIDVTSVEWTQVCLA